MKKIQIITLLPEIFEPVFNSSMLWKAQKNGAVSYSTVNLREFGIGPRKQVDDTPYGGGDGMLLMIEPLKNAILQAKQNDPDAEVFLMSPRGKTFNQPMAEQFAKSEKGMILVCGRYEGFDERVMNYVDGMISVGDFVLTGGEIPAMAIVDAITRLLPGVLGGEKSAEIESFANGTKMLEYPQYTRPEDFEGMKVPEVLLSGHHANIEKWRLENMVEKNEN